MDPLNDPMSPVNAPTVDVYAGDVAPPGNVHTSAARTYVFDIRADADPDVFSRVAGIFNIANIAPTSAELHREFEQVRIAVAIELEDMTVPEMIRRKLAQLTCVTAVELRLRLP